MKKLIPFLIASALVLGALWAYSSQAQEDPGDFVPSEKVPADSSVSFPVDI